MDFELSEEQRLLKDSVERLVADRYDFSARQRFMQEPTGFSRELWRQYSELGLSGCRFRKRTAGSAGAQSRP
jgi:alkylation response protein AidB-like acyl-CoA dehydrogenase